MSNEWTGLSSSSSSLTHLLPAGVHTLWELLHWLVHQLLQGKDRQRPRIEVAVSIEHVWFRVCDLLEGKREQYYFSWFAATSQAAFLSEVNIDPRAPPPRCLP